jgi:hypothetical protein
MKKKNDNPSINLSFIAPVTDLLAKEIMFSKMANYANQKIKVDWELLIYPF